MTYFFYFKYRNRYRRRHDIGRLASRRGRLADVAAVPRSGLRHDLVRGLFRDPRTRTLQSHVGHSTVDTFTARIPLHFRHAGHWYAADFFSIGPFLFSGPLSFLLEIKYFFWFDFVSIGEPHEHGQHGLTNGNRTNGST